MTNYMKTCSFLLAHFTETMRVVKNLFSKKLMVKNSIENEIAVAHIRFGSMRQFHCVLLTYATESKATYFEFTPYSDT